MHHALGAKILEGVDNVASEELGHLWAERTVLLQELRQVSVDGIVKEHVVVLLVGPGRLHVEDVVVLE